MHMHTCTHIHTSVVSTVAWMHDSTLACKSRILSGAHSDMTPFLPAVYKSCSDTEFQCRQGHKCIPKADQCNGNVDCPDQSDETNCVTSPCGDPNLFQCPGGSCIPKELVCNGYKDCEDGADEPHNCGELAEACLVVLYAMGFLLREVWCGKGYLLRGVWCGKGYLLRGVWCRKGYLLRGVWCGKGYLLRGV